MDKSNPQIFHDPPEGWRKVVKRRKRGKTAGKFDIYYYNSDGQKFRSYVELEKHLQEIGSSLPLECFNFIQSKESSEIDISCSTINIKRFQSRSKKNLKKNFNVVTSVPTNQFDLLSTERLGTNKLSLPTKKRGRPRKIFQTKKPPQRLLNGEAFSLPSEQINIQKSAERFETNISPSISNKRRRVGKKFRSKKASKKNLDAEASALLSDQFTLQHIEEEFETNASSSSADKRSQIGNRFQSEKASKYFSDEGPSLSSDPSTIQHSEEAFETNTPFLSTDKSRVGKRFQSEKASWNYLNDEEDSLSLDQFSTQHDSEIEIISSSSDNSRDSLSLTALISEINEDLLMEPINCTSSLEKYSNELLFLIPINEPQLDDVHEPVFPNNKKLSQDWSTTDFFDNKCILKYG